ncbi:hypothetical protein Fmac_016025 [Flemingia macrophylla]|uniref:Uncharacterized protein n=1 Tax=Flemingia macrophylla TaxID=520843 RepID=A0ABD1MG68_9FABA
MQLSPRNTPRYCNACEKDVTGFLCHCKACIFDLYLLRQASTAPPRQQRGQALPLPKGEVVVPPLCVEGAKLELQDVLLPAMVSYSSHRSKDKKVKKCKIATLALQFVISALLGDPTQFIAGIVGSFMSRA